MKKPVSSPRKKPTKPEKRNEAQEELQDFLLLDEARKIERLFHLYRELKNMSTTESEAIAALQAASAATDANLATVSNAVDGLLAKAADDPTKVAALDGVTAKLVEQQGVLQSIADKISAATTP